jgi:hypothetical protein
VATDLCPRDRGVVPFEPRRTPHAPVARDHGGAKVLHFPASVGAEAGRRSREASERIERESGDDLRYGPIDLLESAIQANVRTVQAIFGLGNSATWIELQQRAIQDYVAASATFHLGLVRAMSNAVTGCAAGTRSVQTTQEPLYCAAR